MDFFASDWNPWCGKSIRWPNWYSGSLKKKVIVSLYPIINYHGEGVTFTHPFNNLPIPVMAYFINILGSQTSERDRGKPTFLYFGDISYKTINYNWANFQKFPIKWIFGRSSQTLPRIFMLCPYYIKNLGKVWVFLLKIHLIGNFWKLAQL